MRQVTGGETSPSEGGRTSVRLRPTASAAHCTCPECPVSYTVSRETFARRGWSAAICARASMRGIATLISMNGAHCAPIETGRCPVCRGPALRGRRCCSSGCSETWARDHVWPHARRVALAEAGWQCSVCGVTDWDAVLEVHHVTPVDSVHGYRLGCQHHRSGLVVLCAFHHRREHVALRAKPFTQLQLVPA